MESWSIGTYLERLAARSPTPAGGAVAALTLAQAASLLAMAARFATDPGPGAVEQAESVRDRALQLAEDDVRVFDEVAAAYALPRGTDGEREARSTAITAALLSAAGPPAALVGLAGEALVLAERLVRTVRPAVAPDVAAAADALAATASTSRTNVEANIRRGRETEQAQRLAATLRPVDDLLRRAARVRESVRGVRTG